MPASGLIVTGTDTSVGKTYVSSQIISQMMSAGLRVGAYKPVCSGCEYDEQQQPYWSDVESLFYSLNGQYERNRISPQTFRAPLAPPRAAIEEGRDVSTQLIQQGHVWWSQQVDYLLIEGAGGLLAPITNQHHVVDLFPQYPYLVVARAGLGTINHTLLTVEVLKQRGCKIAGVILNHVIKDGQDLSVKFNRDDLKNLLDIPILGEMYRGANLLDTQSSASAASFWKRLFDISTLLM